MTPRSFRRRCSTCSGGTWREGPSNKGMKLIRSASARQPRPWQLIPSVGHEGSLAEPPTYPACCCPADRSGRLHHIGDGCSHGLPLRGPWTRRGHIVHCFPSVRPTVTDRAGGRVSSMGAGCAKRDTLPNNALQPTSKLLRDLAAAELGR